MKSLPADLIKERDRILREAGFVDIEDSQGRIKEATAYKELCRMGVDGARLLVETGQAADNRAHAVLATNLKRFAAGVRYGRHGYAFTEKFQREAWALHADGQSLTAIAETLGTTRSRVHAAIKPIGDGLKRVTTVTKRTQTMHRIKQAAEDIWLTSKKITPIKRHKTGRLPKSAWTTV